MNKKVERIINLYNRLYDGEVLVKSEEADRFGSNERSIPRVYHFEDAKKHQESL